MLKSTPEAQLAETTLSYWKKYQERLDKFPFTKLTTKEILEESFTKELEKPLHAIDRLDGQDVELTRNRAETHHESFSAGNCGFSLIFFTMRHEKP